MGYDAYAYGVLGIKIDVSKLFAPVKVPHAEHTVPANAKYCPECGEPACKVVRKFLLSDENTEEHELAVLEEYLSNLKPARKIDIVVADCEKPGPVYVGWKFEAPIRIDILKLDATHHKNVLAGIIPQKYWKDDDFGLWIVKYESY